MENNPSDKLSSLEKDALIEISNIGAGNSTIPLSKLLNKKVELYLGDLEVIDINEEEKRKKDTPVSEVGMHTPITKGMSGHIVIMFKAESVSSLTHQLLWLDSSNENVSDTEILQNKELLINIGSTLSNSYISALNDFLGLDLECGQTRVIATYRESVFDIILTDLEKKATKALFIKTQFKIEKTILEGNFVLLLAISSMEKMLSKVRSMIPD